MAFGHPKNCAFHGSCAPGTSSVRCSRLFGHSLLVEAAEEIKLLGAGDEFLERRGAVVGKGERFDVTDLAGAAKRAGKDERRGQRRDPRADGVACRRER